MQDGKHTAIHTAIEKCALFDGVSVETLALLLKEAELAYYLFSPGEEIPLMQNGTRVLALLVDGLAFAYSPDAERSVILRAIPPGTVFGVSVLFSEDVPVSVIRAKTNAAVLYLKASLISDLLVTDATFRMNYIAFLSDRIRFLNRRIACYTAGTAERKLALYLAELPTNAEGIATLDVSMTALCELLDIGRASLYRAFTHLSDAALILRNDREIHILDKNALLSYGTVS